MGTPLHITQADKEPHDHDYITLAESPERNVLVQACGLCSFVREFTHKEKDNDTAPP